MKEGRAGRGNRLAIVLPVHNESASIERTIREVVAWAKDRPAAEVFVFEDGSDDGTTDILRKLEGEIPALHISTTPERKGYPRAVRDAILAIPPERFDLLLVADSDGQYDFANADGLMDAMAGGDVDIVVGRRKTRPEPIYRRIPSHGLRVLERIFFEAADGDITSAFRLVRIDMGRKVADQVRHSPFNFWLEFTARSSMMRLRQREVAVDYRDRAGETKVYLFHRMPKVLWSELLALFKTRRDFLSEA